MNKTTASKVSFPVGYHEFHEDPRLNANLNLYHSVGIFSREELEEIGKQITDFDSWISVFRRLGEENENKCAYLKAATCYYAAMFHTLSTAKSKDGGSAKHELYEKTRRLYDKHYARFTALKYERIPFGEHELPVYYSLREDAKGTILFHGGYDSIIQEFLGLFRYFRDLGYNIYFFEGPGQGEVLMRQGLHMTEEWEHCTGAVLDYFGLDDVTLIGISLGGYLATRAAAYDKRIGRLVMCDLIYDFYGAILGKMDGNKRRLFDYLVRHPKNPLWRSVTGKLDESYFTKWLIDQGYSVFGNVHTPCEYFDYIKRFSTRDISKLITCDTLVLAGASDLYTIYYDEQLNALCNAKSVTGRLFTEEECADHHCQVGNIGLLLDTITDWIEEKTYGQKKNT